MKKILCFVMALMMLVPMFNLSVFAAEDNGLSQLFYNYCVENLPEDMQPKENDTVNVYLSYVLDGVTFFAAKSWLEDKTDVVCKFGDIYVHSKVKYYPYELGIYASSGDEIYTLEEAYNINLIEDVSLLYTRFGRYDFYEEYVPNPESKYESEIINKVFPYGAWNEPDTIDYDEIYEYYSEESSADEATPDYVLVYLQSNMASHIPVADVLGDYFFYSMSAYHPFCYGYCIYIPETGEVYGLTKAYELGIEGIENIFTEGRIGRLIGDMDKDRKLTVKDATYIQKALAGIEGFTKQTVYGASFDDTLPVSISDFNRDRVINIKDATAIQKHIAGIEA